METESKQESWKRPLLILALGGLIGGAIASWVAGTILMARSDSEVARPVGWGAEDVGFDTAMGDSIRGWWQPGIPGAPAIILVHGIRADRLAMLERARLFSRQGYSVFLFDLPAHGASSGESISFGQRESAAVSAALQWVRARQPGVKVGVDGVSLGGAAVLLREEHTGFDAIVVEAVFPDIHRAILNRLTDRFGFLGYVLEPLLEVQLVLRLHEWPHELSPVNQVGKVGAPILVIGGGQDHLTPVSETMELYRRAAEPKDFWIVPGAGHADFLRAQPEEFQRRVGAFFARYLQPPSGG